MLKFEVVISQISNPSNQMIRGTNDPKNRPMRIVDNLRARKGQVGDWAKFQSFSQFDSVPLDDIQIEVKKRVFVSKATDIKECN